MGKYLLNLETTSVRTIYVSPTGSDLTGDGSQTKPYQTIQMAVEDAVFRPNNGFDVTIQLMDGTYNITESVMLKPSQGNGLMKIQGNASSPLATTVISSAGGFDIDRGAFWTLANMRIESVGHAVAVGICRDWNGNGEAVLDNLQYGNCLSYIAASGTKARIGALTTLTVAGTPAGIFMVGGAELRLGAAVQLFAPGQTIVHGVLAEDLARIIAFGSYTLGFNTTCINDPNGTPPSRCSVWGNSIVHVYSGGDNYFPGDQPVDEQTGGRYIP